MPPKFPEGQTINGVPAKDWPKVQKERAAAKVANLRARRAKIIEFDEEDWVTIDFIRDDGTRDRAVFKLSSWCGLTPERLAAFQKAQKRGMTYMIGPGL